MKKVTLLLPDEVVSVGGKSRSSTRETLPPNAQTVMQALTSNDYHLNCFFQAGTVEVVSIEDVEPEVIRVHSASESGRENRERTGLAGGRRRSSQASQAFGRPSVQGLNIKRVRFRVKMQENLCYSFWLAAILTILFVATLTASPSKYGSEEIVRKSMSKDQVLGMVGPPKSKQNWSAGKETWYYDGCYIRFENEKVIAFSGLCTGLTPKVNKSREKPPRVAKGLSRKQVLAILGPPFTKRNQVWEYRDCSVIFEKDRVLHYLERNLGRRTKGPSVKGRPRVNKERTKPAIVATQLTPEELEKQKALEQAIIKEMQRRKDVGVSGEHCETEYKTNAEVCIEITDVDLDCNESYLGNYYQDCDVSISYDITTDYKGGSYLEVDISCRVEIEYEGRQTYFTNSESSSSDESHNLYALGSDSNTTSFNFSFSSFDEVVKATISSAECEIESVNLW